MAEGLNRAMLLGNLGQDPELKTTSGGQSVLKMRIATSESYLDRDKQRQERTEWHTVVLWGKRAESLGRLLSKGDRIFVEGRISTRSWEDREGGKRYATEVVATNVILNGRGEPRNGGYHGGGGGQQSRQDPPPDESGEAYGGDFGQDDIPFSPELDTLR